MLGKAANVQLVDDRLTERPLELNITLPVVVGQVGRDALHRRSGVVAPSGRFRSVVAGADGDRSPVGIEQRLVAIEAPVRASRHCSARLEEASSTGAGMIGLESRKSLYPQRMREALDAASRIRPAVGGRFAKAPSPLERAQSAPPRR